MSKGRLFGIYGFHIVLKLPYIKEWILRRRDIDLFAVIGYGSYNFQSVTNVAYLKVNTVELGSLLKVL